MSSQHPATRKRARPSHQVSLPVGQVTSIDILSDDVLLAIFDFCMDEYQYTKEEIEAWQSLVHVCRRWRNIVFGSPRRLNLRLVIKDKTSVRDMLDVWPPLPLVIYGDPTGVDFSNIVSVLEHRDRVDEIRLWQVYGFALEKLLAVMQEPFPELTDLMLRSYDETVPVVPDSFLGGSAPRLRKLVLVGIPFPGLPNLLLSSAHLVGLYLENIPQTGYISPAAMVTTLSTLTNLESLSLQFQSPRSHPEPASRLLLPSTRSVLPVFTRFSFKGACEYLNDFVAHIVAPRLDELFITLFNDIVFDAPQFIQFISRTPTLKPLETGRIVFEDHAAKINLSSQKSGYGSLEVRISCREFDWQVSSLEQVCTLCLPPLSALEDLCIYQHTLSYPHWKDYIDNTLWVELLQPFTAVKKLYLSKELAPRIVPALQELVGGRTAEVLPALQNILLEELQPSARVQDDIRQFVSMRQAIGHSIVVSLWDRLPTTKSTARRKPAIACLFCLQRKIACSAPPVGSADMTCSQCARRSRKCEYPIIPRRRDNGGDHAPYIKEDQAQEQLQVGTSVSRASTPLHGYDSLHHQQHTLDSFDLVQDPATYPEFASRPYPYSFRTPSPLSS